jgi:hypothetical protein
MLLTQLAHAKGLPEEFLREELKLHDLDGGRAIGIPYYGETGEEIAVKRRTALKAKDESGWPKGKPLAAYGLWRLDRAYKAAFVALVEGESDCWALWHHGIPALGIPCASGAKVLEAEHLSCVEKVYINREPDKGRETFVAGVRDRLAYLGFKGQVFELRMPDGIKDPADLHVADPDKFEARFQEAILSSVPLELPQSQRAGAPGDKDAPPAVPVVVRLDEVTPLAVEWLWPGWIPRGTLTLLDGNPGVGKSTLALDLAARLTRRLAMPRCEGQTSEPAGVLLLSAEDDLERTIRPRLDAAGADMTKVHALTAIRVGEEEQPPVLPLDLDSIEAIITKERIGLVIVDPFMAYLDSQINAHKDQDVRRCLHRLKLLAERTGAAIVLIRHLNKLNYPVAMYRGGGSIGIIGAVRSALMAGRHPDEPHGLVLAPVKCNLGPMPKSVTYSLHPVGNVARIGWGQETDLTADDILRPSSASGGESKAEQFLRETLASSPIEAVKVYELAKKAGISEASIKRAKKKTGVESFKDGFAKGWQWRLPSAEGGHEEGQTQKVTPFGKNGEKSTVSPEEGQGPSCEPLRNGEDDSEVLW